MKKIKDGRKDQCLDVSGLMEQCDELSDKIDECLRRMDKIISTAEEIESSLDGMRRETKKPSLRGLKHLGSVVLGILGKH